MEIRLFKNDAGVLAPVKEFLGDMTEKMPARCVHNPINGLCAVMP